jgi:hypothetical protein
MVCQSSDLNSSHSVAMMMPSAPLHASRAESAIWICFLAFSRSPASPGCQPTHHQHGVKEGSVAKRRRRRTSVTSSQICLVGTFGS